MSENKRCLIPSMNAKQQKSSREKWDDKKKQQENTSAKLCMQKMRALRKEAVTEDWQKLARTGEIVWFYNGRDRKKTGKIVRNGHFGRTVSESWLNPWFLTPCQKAVEVKLCL